MSRSNKSQARQADTKPQEDAVPPVGEATTSPAEAPVTPPVDAQEVQAPVKEVENDQTSSEPGHSNATVEQVEARKDVVLNQEQPDPVAAEIRDPEAADDHQLVPARQPVPLSLEEEALLAQAEAEDKVRNAFVAETRRETLDTFRPQRVEDVRIVVETNVHPDRSGDNVRESADKIVISDGVDEARMIDVQPEGTVSEEIDLGNGIKQTNLK